MYPETQVIDELVDKQQTLLKRPLKRFYQNILAFFPLAQ